MKLPSNRALICAYDVKTPSAALAKPNPVSIGLLVSLPKFSWPWNSFGIAELLLLLQAVIQLIAGLDRVPALELRHADGDVVGADHVEEPAGVVLQARRRQVRRAAANAAAPRERRRHVDAAVDVERRVRRLQHLFLIAARLDDTRIGVQHREVAEPDIVSIRERAHHDRALLIGLIETVRRPRRQSSASSCSQPFQRRP